MGTTIDTSITEDHPQPEEQVDTIDEFLSKLATRTLRAQVPEVPPFLKQTVSVQQAVVKMFAGHGQSRMCRRTISLFFHTGERMVRYRKQTSLIREVLGRSLADEAIAYQESVFQDLLGTLRQFINTKRLEIPILIEPALVAEAPPDRNYLGIYNGWWGEAEGRQNVRW